MGRHRCHLMRISFAARTNMALCFFIAREPLAVRLTVRFGTAVALLAFGMTKREGQSKAGPSAGCVELWAANERTHRHIELANLHCDVVSLPCGDSKGGDLWAVFSCGGNKSVRVVLADSPGHGFTASAAAEEVHRLLHKFSGTKDAASLLAALNDDLAHDGNSANQASRRRLSSAAPLRWSIVAASSILHMRRIPACFIGEHERLAGSRWARISMVCSSDISREKLTTSRASGLNQQISFWPSRMVLQKLNPHKASIYPRKAS